MGAVEVGVDSIFFNIRRIFFCFARFIHDGVGNPTIFIAPEAVSFPGSAYSITKDDSRFLHPLFVIGSFKPQFRHGEVGLIVNVLMFFGVYFDNSKKTDKSKNYKSF